MDNNSVIHDYHRIFVHRFESMGLPHAADTFHIIALHDIPSLSTNDMCAILNAIYRRTHHPIIHAFVNNDMDKLREQITTHQAIGY